jgi:RNA polymerase sigma-70 factor (ECF subfamily)
MNGADGDDARRVRDFLAGRSEAAFLALYRAHSPYLFGLALRLAGGRRDDAEDALQEAWLRATERLGQFRFESALRTWLAGFVVRCGRELRRRRHPAREEPAGGFELEEVAPTVPPALPEIDLERALAKMPPTLRDVLVLHEIEGLSHDEIGRVLEIPAGTSKSRLWFARRALRGALGVPEPDANRRKESR